MSERVSMREYARRRGCTLRAVQKAIETNRIALIDGKIDPELADRQWAARTDPLQQLRGNGGVPPAPRVPQPPAEPIQVLEDGADRLPLRGVEAEASGAADASSCGADGISYTAAKAQGEFYRAQLYRLELEEKRGHLVRADEVRKTAFTRARVARDRLLAVPTRVASLLAAESDPAKCHAILESEMRRVCAEIATAEAAELAAA
jgi:hypothetical protein